jgi:predicted nucleotidyltransferase
MASVRVFQKRIIKILKNSRDFCFPIKLQQFSLFRLFQNWLCQGMSLAHWTELVFRVCLEIMVFLGLLAMLLIWLEKPILPAAILAHTLMWTFNGHFWALKINKKKRLIKNTARRIKKYLKDLENRVKRADSITGCVLSGSLTENRFHEYSDLDVWLTKNSGFIKGLIAYSFGVRERSIAFLQKIPIELYFYDPDDYLAQDSDEPLLLVKDVNSRWMRAARKSIALEDFSFEQMAFFQERSRKD